MKHNTKFRKNIRVQHFDYAANGAYFVTICTNFKRNFIQDREKQIIKRELNSLEDRFKGIKIDIYTVMSNHLHFIIWLDNSRISLSKIIQAFKSITTLRLKKAGFNKDLFWQRNFYEHIIRNENALIKIREYIKNNPHTLKIDLDDLYGSECS